MSVAKHRSSVLHMRDPRRSAFQFQPLINSAGPRPKYSSAACAYQRFLQFQGHAAGTGRSIILQQARFPFFPSFVQ